MTEEAPRTPPTDRPLRRVLLGIVCCAFVVRAFGAFGQGVPFAYYPDESRSVEQALYFGAMKTADPGWFNKPALTYYLLFAVCGAVYVGGRVGGAWPGGVEEFGAFAATNYGPFLIAGRLMNAAFGALTVWLVYLLGKKLKDRTTGLVAALVLAFAPGDFLSARVLKEDAPTSFFLTAALLSLVDVATKARPKDYLRAGLLAGLGMAAKYNAAAVLVPAAFAHFFRDDPRARGGPSRRGAGLAALGGVAFVAAFFAGAPYCFLNPLWRIGQVEPALRRMAGPLADRPAAAFAAFAVVAGAGLLCAAFLRRRAARAAQAPASDAARPGGGGALSALALGVAAPQFEAYGRMSDTAGTFSLLDRLVYGVRSLTVGVADQAGARYGGLGTALTVVAALGLALTILRPTRARLLLLVAAGGHLLFVAAAGRQLPEPRHLIAVYPIAAFWCAEAFVAGAAALRRALRRSAPLSWRAPAALFGLAALVPTPDPVPLGGSLVAAHAAAACGAYADDTRTSALRFLERQAEPGATIVNFHEALPLRMDARRARFMAERQRGIRPGDPRNHQRAYGRKWELLARAAEVPGRPAFDTLAIVVPWQSEDGSEAGRKKGNEGFQDFWPTRCESLPADVPPVERYRRIPWGADPAAVPDGWPAARWMIPGSQARWLAVAESTYNNYDRPEKRRNFPDFAAFFDDLRTRYDAFQWSPSDGRTGPRIRVYDLSRRRDDRPATVVEMIAE